jgi:hypothetical protein
MNTPPVKRLLTTLRHNDYYPIFENIMNPLQELVVGCNSCKHLIKHNGKYACAKYQISDTNNKNETEYLNFFTAFMKFCKGSFWESKY